MKKKNVSARTIMIRFLLAVAALFLLLNGAWLYFRQHCFVTVANRAGLTEPEHSEPYNYMLTVPSADENRTANYAINCPRYLRFGSNYFASDEPNSYTERDGKWLFPFDFRVFLSIHPKLFGKTRYQLSIYDYRTANEEYLAGKTDSIDPQIYTFEVDENMEILQEHTYGGTAVYDAAYEDAHALFCRAKAVFGL